MLLVPLNVIPRVWLALSTVPAPVHWGWWNVVRKRLSSRFRCTPWNNRVVGKFVKNALFVIYDVIIFLSSDLLCLSGSISQNNYFWLFRMSAICIECPEKMDLYVGHHQHKRNSPFFYTITTICPTLFCTTKWAEYCQQVWILLHRHFLKRNVDGN